MQALRDIKARSPEAQIILLTGHATVEKGVEAIKAGATDFLEKPADLEELEKKIKDASTRRMLIVEKQAKDKLKDTLRRFGF